MNKRLSGVGLILLGLVLACLAVEGLVRLSTSAQQNYLIEMWRYATLLKRDSVDPIIGHEHIPGASAVLQKVNVSINSLGMRGPEPDLSTPGKTKIVIVGDSTAMGWGLPEDQTLRGQMARWLGPSSEVMTTGVGNMNMTQIVANWLRYVDRVRPDTVVVLATARAPAVLNSEKAGWLVRHSQAFALVISFVEIALSNAPGRKGLIDSYKAMWTGGAGLTAMRQALDRLKESGAKHGYRVLVLMVPEPHSFHPYNFDFTTDTMRSESAARGWTFVDPLPLLRQRPAESYWVASNDVHPNKEAFEVMIEALKPHFQPARD